MKSEQGQSLGYIAAIDGLRAVAVVAVVLFHLWPHVLPGGFVGVDIFFVVSGFVVTGSMLGRSFDSLGALAAHFYARRLLRIMPALMVMLLATTLATQLFIPDAWLSNSVAQVGRFAFAGLSNVVLGTESDTYFAPRTSYDPFTHSWSLGVEEQFYLLFPLILWWRARAVRTVAILSLLSLGACAVLTFVAPKLAFYMIFARFWELGVGMLLSLTIPRWRGWAERQRGLSVAGLVLLGSGLALGNSALFPFPHALLPVAGTAALLMAVVAGHGPGLLGARPVVAVGLLSYSLYLWHWPVLVLMRWTSGLHTLPLQLLGLGVAILLALASYFLVERPFRYSRWLAVQPRVPLVLGMLAAALLCLFGANRMIAAHDRITLSVTRDHHAWYADPDRALDPRISHCAVGERSEALARGRVTVWTPGCAPRFTLFVPGDSHALAYAPALRQLAAETGAQVRVYFRPSCPYLRLIEPQSSRSNCADWFAAVRDAIVRESRAGDVVFLPGLRVTRLTNQFENDRALAQPHDDRVSAAALAEARTVLAQLASNGARLVLEAPKPLFPSPIFRCADWFNRRNPICNGLSIDRETMLERRRPVIRAMSRLVADQPGAVLWDPLPLLCPGKVCEAMPAGRPLFFDGDHPSGLGNDLLYPDLKRVIMAR
jgi:peptidoglycan/LPS O-acetylase OafA/YrhL